MLGRDFNSSKKFFRPKFDMVEGVIVLINQFKYFFKKIICLEIMTSTFPFKPIFGSFFNNYK